MCLTSAIAEIAASLPAGMELFCADSVDTAGVTSLAELLPEQSTEIITEKYLGYNDPMVYIYTRYISVL